MLKLIACLKRKSGITREEFSRHWREIHGPLVTSVPEFMRHVRKYVQCHIAKDSAPLGASSEFDGVAELWFDNAAAIKTAFEEPRYLELIRPDEVKFIDLEASMIFLTEEFPMHG
jgi:uncharacterized protein (TIGR02118 family)